MQFGHFIVGQVESRNQGFAQLLDELERFGARRDLIRRKTCAVSALL